MKRHRIIRIFSAVLSCAGIIWFSIPFHWGVANIGNLSGISVCVLVLAAALFYPWIKRKCNSYRRWKICCHVIFVLFCAGLVWTAILTGLMITGIQNAPPENATVVVLGSKVSGHVPSADLRVRIEAAGAYLAANPQAQCIVSGGQGAGELETEASVMKKYLVQQGIDASRIFVEDKSMNTEQNLENSLAIIDQNGMSRSLAIVTDEYHQYRAGSIAKYLGAVPYSVCASTPWYIFSACYARELLALTKFLVFP